MIDQRGSDSEGVPHVIRIGNANRLIHGIVDDLEKVRVVGWQRVEGVDISPMAVIVGINQASTGYKISVYPDQAKSLGEFSMPLQAPGVTLTGMTGTNNPGIRNG